MALDNLNNITLPSGRIAESSVSASIKAMQLITENLSGIQTGLYSRYKAINSIVMKYFRFKNSYVICGSSGTGKSYFLNTIINDFSQLKDFTINDITIPAINRNFPDEVLFVNLCYEMPSEAEKLRTISTILNVSYDYLLSSKFTKFDEEGNPVYAKLLQKDKDAINLLFDSYLTRQGIYYVENSDTLDNTYKDICYLKSLFPNKRLCVSLDHALLSEVTKDEFSLARETADFATRLTKQQNALVIILNQMNDNILKIERVKFPQKHYPDITDGYGGRQLYQGVDYYAFLNRPRKCGILEYGIYKIPTSFYITQEDVIRFPNILTNDDVGLTLDLIHYYQCKARFTGDVLNAFFLNTLHRGTLTYIDESFIRKDVI